MKFYVMTDLEGVAGVTEFEDRTIDTLMNHHTRRRMQQLLTAEVNAAIDGLFAAGAHEVIVNDGHGAGYTIDAESLDPRAQIVHGQQRPHWLPFLDPSCTATLLIGAHAKAGTTGATAYHTMSKAIKEWSINGVSLGEIGLQALIAGSHGVPFIYLSGDDHACREVAALIPGIVTTAVKKGLSRRSALSWAPQRAREMIRADVQRAVANLGQVQPLVLDPPLVMHDARYDDSWSTAKPSAGITVLDGNTREVRADSVTDLLVKLYGYDPTWTATTLQADLEG